MADWVGVLKGAVKGYYAARKKKKVESVPMAVRKHRAAENRALADAGITEADLRKFR